MGENACETVESPHGYQPPTCEIICLACEISAYAPDDDLPLF